MLGKLLKYDFKAAFKYFLPMSVFILVSSCLGTILFRLGMSDNNESSLMKLFAGISVVIFVLLLISYTLITQGIIVVSFYKSMVTDTGYLTHTLPVSKAIILTSKLISGTILVFTSYAVSLISAFIMFNIPGNMMKYRPVLREIISFTTREIRLSSLTMYSISMLFAIVAGTIFSVCMFYLSIALGQLMGRHKVIGAFVSYFGIKIAIQFISTIVSFSMQNMFQRMNALNLFNFMTTFTSGMGVGLLALAAIMFGLTLYIFNNKLNLD